MMGEDKEFLKAKNCAYKLLSYRPRSTKEITQRLKDKGFTPKAICKTIEYLSELNYLNDENFAKFWIQSKIRLKPVGFSLLRYQLRQKGVAEEILEKVLSNLTRQYNEYEAAKKLATSQVNRYRGLAPLVLKRRLYDYLCRRGFSQEAISQAIVQTTEDRC